MISKSFGQLLLMNIKLLYRNKTGLFFTLAMPSAIYIALSILPIGSTLAGAGLNYSSFLLPGIIAMTVMQGGVYGLAYWMIDLKSRGVIKRFLVTPISQKEIVLSVLLSRVIVAVVQTGFLMAVGKIFFNAKIGGNFLAIFLVVAIGAAIFLLVGLLISMVADSYEASAPITTAIGLPMTFLGNIFFPLSAMPGVLRKIGELLPITYMADSLRRLFLQNASILSLGRNLLILGIWLVFILALTLWKFRLKE